MRSFNGGFLPWRCSGRQRKRGERRRHPLRNKSWKKELGEDASMEEKKEGEKERGGSTKLKEEKKRKRS